MGMEGDWKVMAERDRMEMGWGGWEGEVLGEGDKMGLGGEETGMG